MVIYSSKRSGPCHSQRHVLVFCLSYSLLRDFKMMPALAGVVSLAASLQTQCKLTECCYKYVCGKYHETSVSQNSLMPARSVCGLTNPWMFSVLLHGFIKYNLSPHQFPWEGEGRERLTSPGFWQQTSTTRMHRDLIFRNSAFQRKSPRAGRAVCCVSWSVWRSCAGGVGCGGPPSSAPAGAQPLPGSSELPPPSPMLFLLHLLPKLTLQSHWKYFPIPFS